MNPWEPSDPISPEAARSPQQTANPAVDEILARIAQIHSGVQHSVESTHSLSAAEVPTQKFTYEKLDHLVSTVSQLAIWCGLPKEYVAQTRSSDTSTRGDFALTA